MMGLFRMMMPSSVDTFSNLGPSRYAVSAPPINPPKLFLRLANLLNMPYEFCISSQAVRTCADFFWLGIMHVAGDALRMHCTTASLNKLSLVDDRWVQDCHTALDRRFNDLRQMPKPNPDRDSMILDREHASWDLQMPSGFAPSFTFSNCLESTALLTTGW